VGCAGGDEGGRWSERRVVETRVGDGGKQERWTREWKMEEEMGTESYWREKRVVEAAVHMHQSKHGKQKIKENYYREQPHLTPGQRMGITDCSPTSRPKTDQNEVSFNKPHHLQDGALLTHSWLK